MAKKAHKGAKKKAVRKRTGFTKTVKAKLKELSNFLAYQGDDEDDDSAPPPKNATIRKRSQKR